MQLNIAYIPGDGIGPEIGAVSVNILKTVCDKYGYKLNLAEHDFGGIAIDNHGEPLPQSTLDACQSADAVLMGAIGGPEWVNASETPENGLLKLRKSLGTFSNIRPVKIIESLADNAPIKPEILNGTDIVVVRELTGGIYFGEKSRDKNAAQDLCSYTRPEIERIVRMAAKMAQGRGSKLTSVDKANVLETSKLWREVTAEIMANEFPDVELNHLYVDAAAMFLVTKPSSFDVIVTENMFGDILTDEASVLSGSLGLLPSASLGEDGKPGIFEPIHGAANDIAGQNIANPTGMILSVAMMLRHAFGLEDAAQDIEEAIDQAYAQGAKTKDLGGNMGTKEFGDAVNNQLLKQAKAA